MKALKSIKKQQLTNNLNSYIVMDHPTMYELVENWNQTLLNLRILPLTHEYIEIIVENSKQSNNKYGAARISDFEKALKKLQIEILTRKD